MKQLDMSTMKWVEDPNSPGLFNAVINVFPLQLLVAWIQKRPAYCDPGHYQANINIDVGLDDADGFPRYYMTLETAMKEIELFLDWRINKVAAVDHKVYPGGPKPIEDDQPHPDTEGPDGRRNP